MRALANALATNRLHHAYLFTGTRGVGKTTVARILAKSLDCIGPDGTGGVTAQPCGVCQPCREIDAGRFIDYVELDAASNRGVEEISRLLDQAVYKPVLGRYKVYLIDEVHMLSTTAFNAMLKTLEEPPPYLKFILATTDPQKVPATVLSRCLQFNLRPMAPETIVAHLVDVLARERIEVERPALALVARAARGSMRDALSLADQAIAHGGGAVRTDAVRQMLGAVGREHALALIEAAAAGDGGRVVDGVRALRDLGLSPTGALEEIAEILQDVAVAAHAPSADETDAGQGDGGDDGDSGDSGDGGDGAAIARLAAAIPADTVQFLYALAIHGRADLALAPDEYGGLMMVLLRAVAFAPEGGASAAAPSLPPSAASSAPSRPAPPASTPTPTPRAPQPIAPAPVQSASVASSADATVVLDGEAARDRWVALVRQMMDAGRIQAMVRELAWQAECIGVAREGAAEVWRLRVEREPLRADACREKLETALASALERPARIRLEAGVAADSPATRDAAERERRQQEAERTIREDPLVRALLSQYKTARIVPGSIKAH